MAGDAGMNWFHSCYGDGKLEGVMPAYTDFGKSLLVSFQVLTGDGWTTLMLNHMECKGNEASVFFIVLQFTCSFVLCNLFVAIFIENFEIEDEDKRKMQISEYVSEFVRTCRTRALCVPFARALGAYSPV